MQARWVANEDANVEIQRGPAASSERINARIERYAINNNGSAVYFVRAETGGTERTLSSLKFEQFRSLHRRLAEEGGVLYATGGSFPRALRKARIGYATNVTLMTAGSTLAKRRFRLTPTEIGEQCEGLNAWLRETTANVEQLPLALQKELRQFLGLDGSAPPAWTTAKTSGGLFAGAMATGRQRGATKKREAVYPLGDSANLPGVTRRGRLECRDRSSNQWLSTHVILTHLSLLVFQPLDEAAQASKLTSATSKHSREERDDLDNSRRSAAESMAAEYGSPGAHPFAAALAEGVNGGITSDGPEKAVGTRSSSQGRLLHNVHVTDVLSIVRHGDSESVSAPPIHHRCFTITDLNDVSVTLRAVNARDCLQWLKAISRAKDRALAAVHRLDDKSHGHELVLATLKRARPDGEGRSSGQQSATLSSALFAASPVIPPSEEPATDKVVAFDERIVSRGKKPGLAYGWFEPLVVEVVDATLRFELNAGEMEVRVGSLLERCASDAAAGLGPPTSAAAAEAASSGAARAAFWAKVVSPDDAETDQRSERLEVLLAIDATQALAAGEAWRAKRIGGNTKTAAMARFATAVCRLFARRARRLYFVCFKNDTKVAAAVAAAVFSALFAISSDGPFSSRVATFTVDTPGAPVPRATGRLVLLLTETPHSEGIAASTLAARASLLASMPMLIAASLALLIACICAATLLVIFAGPESAYVDGDDELAAAYSDAVADVFRAARHAQLAIDVRMVNWRWRDADRELRERASLSPYYRSPGIRRPDGPLRHSSSGDSATRAAAVSSASFKSISDAPTTDSTTTESGAILPRKASLRSHAEEDDAASAVSSAATAPPKEVPLPTDVPMRFLGAVRGDHAQALKRWSETVAFREAGNHPEQVLRRPQPHFAKIKARHKHFIHKRDRLGHIVAFEVVEAPNRAFRELAGEGVTVEDVAAHMHFVSAFTYVKILDDVDRVGVRAKDPEGYFLKIIDLKHIGLGDCGGDTARYFRLVASINRHYPERVWRTIIVNAPSVFGVIWTIVSPLLEPNVREKITVLRSSYKDTLRDLIDPDDLPVEYGGNDNKISPEEASLASYVEEINHQSAAPLPSDATINSTDAAPEAHLHDIAATAPESPPPEAAGANVDVALTAGAVPTAEAAPRDVAPASEAVPPLDVASTTDGRPPLNVVHPTDISPSSDVTAPVDVDPASNLALTSDVNSKLGITPPADVARAHAADASTGDNVPTTAASTRDDDSNDDAQPVAADEAAIASQSSAKAFSVKAAPINDAADSVACEIDSPSNSSEIWQN